MSKLSTFLLKHSKGPSVEKQRFFKQDYTDDIFLQVKVPIIKETIKNNIFTFEDAQESLQSKYHEERLGSIFIFVNLFNKAVKKSDHDLSKKIFNFLNKNHKFINNWDLVDSVVYKIHAIYLNKYFTKNEITNYLNSLMHSENIWLQRTSIVCNMYFVKNNMYDYFLPIAEHFTKRGKLNHDLINKATGWILREMGQNNIEELFKFLDKYSTIMPPVMFSYATEKIDKSKWISTRRKH